MTTKSNLARQTKQEITPVSNSWDTVWDMWDRMTEGMFNPWGLFHRPTPISSLRNLNRFQMHATSTEVVVTGELAGYKPDDVQVDYQDGTLIIFSNIDNENGDSRTRRSFMQTISIPYEVDPDRSEAKLVDGLLNVKLPRVVPETKSIKVQS